MSDIKKYMLIGETIFSLIYAKVNAFDDTMMQFILLFIMFYVCMLPVFVFINHFVEKWLDK